MIHTKHLHLLTIGEWWPTNGGQHIQQRGGKRKHFKVKWKRRKQGARNNTPMRYHDIFKQGKGIIDDTKVQNGRKNGRIDNTKVRTGFKRCQQHTERNWLCSLYQKHRPTKQLIFTKNKTKTHGLVLQNSNWTYNIIDRKEINFKSYRVRFCEYVT